MPERNHDRRDSSAWRETEGQDQPSWRDVEALIAEAGRYVEPTEDLRPRVIEEARERYLQRQTIGKLMLTMAAAALCVLSGVSLSSRLQAKAEQAGMPRGDRLERLVSERVRETRQGPEWALAEIVTDWKEDLSLRLPTLDSGRRPGTALQPSRDIRRKD